MTREELLGKIDRELSGMDAESWHNGARAIRAVMELHRPEEQDHKQYEKCWNCNLLYPCPTIQAIEKELQYD